MAAIDRLVTGRIDGVLGTRRDVESGREPSGDDGRELARRSSSVVQRVDEIQDVSGGQIATYPQEGEKLVEAVSVNPLA